MNNPVRNKFTKNQQTAIVASAVVGVAAVIYIRHKYNVKLEKVADNAVQQWVNMNGRAGFKTYLVDDQLVEYINSQIPGALPTVPAAA